MATMVTSTTLTDKQFVQIRGMIKSLAGIHLGDGKKELVKARLNKRLRQLGLGCFDEYIDFVRGDTTGGELIAMLDAISTNLTSFFRESGHFDYLNDKIIPRLKEQAAQSGQNRLRIWSAGCSSGEEPYTIGICTCEGIGNIGAWDAKILATDLSTRVLGMAARGVYTEDRLETVSPQLRNRYFTTQGYRGQRSYRTSDQLRSLMTFSRLNLMDPWPMRGPFDVIFCRNVMIYFDKPTQEKLVGRYGDILGPGGTLFIGHSESLTGCKHKLRYVQPTVYEKS